MAHALYLNLPVLIIPAPSISNRHYLPSYARAIAGLLQMGSAASFTQISIRIPVSDPSELIGQGPSPTTPNRIPSPSAPNGSQSAGLPESFSAGNKHKRISSLSTRPMSLHQNQLGPMQLQQLQTSNNMRVPSGASAASSTMSARSGVNTAAAGADPSVTWEIWDYIRNLCGYHPRLSVSESPRPSTRPQLTFSLGPHKSSPSQCRSFGQVDGRACQKHMASCFLLHPQCQGVSSSE